MPDYEYIKNHYRLIAAHLSRPKQLDSELKAIQQLELVGQLKKVDNNCNATDVVNDKSIFFFKNFRKILETRFSQGSVTV